VTEYKNNIFLKHEDATDALCNLLEYLMVEIREPNNVVSNFFGVKTKEIIQCKECPNCYETLEEDPYLRLRIHK